MFSPDTLNLVSLAALLFGWQSDEIDCRFLVFRYFWSWCLLFCLAFIPFIEKSDIYALQGFFVFLGYWFHTDLGIVLPSLEKFLPAKSLVEELIWGHCPNALVSQFKFLGFKNCVITNNWVDCADICRRTIFLMQHWPQCTDVWYKIILWQDN